MLCKTINKPVMKMHKNLANILSFTITYSNSTNIEAFQCYTLFTTAFKAKLLSAY